MKLLNINGIDYTERIITGSYSVIDTDVYSEWIDANTINHRHVVRSKAAGSFDMEFRNMKEYDDFVNHVEASKKIGGYVPCYLYINNKNKSKSCNLYISFAPSLDRVWGYKDHVPAFTVDVEER
jgi:hypothetical protein